MGLLHLAELQALLRIYFVDQQRLTLLELLAVTSETAHRRSRSKQLKIKPTVLII